VVLVAMATADPKAPIVGKLVKGLLNRRVQGRWYSTQENMWAVVALDKYFQSKKFSLFRNFYLQ
jgi:hypothetical protein